MSEEILINVTPPETRVAVIENGVLQEIIIERTSKRGLVGNVYKGKVCRVLPGMQAAFVDVGLERAAFLHASDIGNVNPGINGEGRKESIDELVREGGYVIVQVLKDPLGTKGARLTTNISIPSRYLVFMPGGRYQRWNSVPTGGAAHGPDQDHCGRNLVRGVAQAGRPDRRFRGRNPVHR